MLLADTSSIFLVALLCSCCWLLFFEQIKNTLPSETFLEVLLNCSLYRNSKLIRDIYEWGENNQQCRDHIYRYWCEQGETRYPVTATVLFSVGIFEVEDHTVVVMVEGSCYKQANGAKPSRQEKISSRYEEKARHISSQLRLMNRILDCLLLNRPQRIKRTKPQKRKRSYKSFLMRLNELLSDGEVLWESDTVFRVGRETVEQHFSDLSKPAFSFKRAMKNHGFTLEERSTRNLFVISNSHMHRKYSSVLTNISSVLGKTPWVISLCWTRQSVCIRVSKEFIWFDILNLTF